MKKFRNVSRKFPNPTIRLRPWICQCWRSWEDPVRHTSSRLEERRKTRPGQRARPIAEVGRGNRYVSAVFYAACYFISSVAVVNLWSPPQTSPVRVLPHRNFIRRPSSSCLLRPLVSPFEPSVVLHQRKLTALAENFHPTRLPIRPLHLLLSVPFSFDCRTNITVDRRRKRSFDLFQQYYSRCALLEKRKIYKERLLVSSLFCWRQLCKVRLADLFESEKDTYSWLPFLFSINCRIEFAQIFLGKRNYVPSGSFFTLTLWMT